MNHTCMRERWFSTVLVCFLTVLVVSFSLSPFLVPHAEATEKEIIIIFKGQILPLTAPIKQVGNVYTLTGDIYGAIHLVEVDDIVLDGAGYTLQGDGTGIGIVITEESSVVIKKLRLKGFDTGIQLRICSNILISGNTIEDNNCGIKLESSSKVIISENNITENNQGILLVQYTERYPPSSENTISGNLIKNNDYGIKSESSSNNNLISGNHIENNRFRGIWLEDSPNNTISENNVNANNFGIFVSGIWPNYDLKNKIIQNNLTNNKRGICLFDCYNNILRNNSMVNNELGFIVSTHELSYMINDVDASNTVDGKPIYYLVNRQGMEVSGDAGYVTLVNCTGMIVHNLNLTGRQGILLAYTKNSTITKNILENKETGILLVRSFDNTISGNVIKNNSYGIYFDDSYNNTIFGNNILNNDVGIYFDGPVPFRLCSNNTIHHNNFINNTKHIEDIHWSVPFSGLAINIWDNGREGNYWSDYNGTDANGDGIGDTPYVIDENNRDHYPLMNPVVISESSDEENPISATEPFPIAWIVAAIAIIAIGGAALLVYFRRIKKNKRELGGPQV